MSVILTNCYNGLMITELNAPLPWFEPKTFNDLVCSKLSLNETDILYTTIKSMKGLGHKNSKSSHSQINWYLTWLLKPVLNEKDN